MYGLLVPYLFLCWGRKLTTKDEFLALMQDTFDVVNNPNNRAYYEEFEKHDFIINHVFGQGYSVIEK